MAPTTDLRHVKGRGCGIAIEPRDKFGSFLTEVTMEGGLRKRSDGYDVSISYASKPTVVNWIIIVVGGPVGRENERLVMR